MILKLLADELDVTYKTLTNRIPYLLQHWFIKQLNLDKKENEKRIFEVVVSFREWKHLLMKNDNNWNTTLREEWYYTVDDVCLHLSKSKQTIWSWIRQGKIKYKLLGKTKKFFTWYEIIRLKNEMNKKK